MESCSSYLELFVVTAIWNDMLLQLSSQGIYSKISIIMPHISWGSLTEWFAISVALANPIQKICLVFGSEDSKIVIWGTPEKILFLCFDYIFLN